MSSNLITIAASGTKAAQAGLDVTAQNIANASTDGYIRRSIDQTALASVGSPTSKGDITLSGVLVTGINRNADAFLQSEVRRTGSDATRADTLVTGLTNLDNAVEQSNVYSSITTFESALTKLSSNPTDSSLRASVLSDASTMAQSFNLASSSLATAATGLQFEASSGVTQVNTLAQNLAALNLKISTDTDPANNSATLLDQRDSILQQLSQYGDITTTIASNGTAQVQMGGASGPVLVSNGTASTLAMATASDGTVSFTLGGSALTLSGGSLAGNQQSLSAAATYSSTLDSIASSLMNTVNSAQTSGAALDGTTGQAMFTGTGAGNMAVALTSGSQIAAAASGSAANSQDTTNLTNLQNSLNSNGIASQMNQLIFSASSAVSSNTTTQTALDTIASKAKNQLASQAGVNLDTEATNLIQYQQAFQASGKVIQVAQTLFEQLLQIS